MATITGSAELPLLAGLAIDGHSIVGVGDSAVGRVAAQSEFGRSWDRLTQNLKAA